MTTADWFAAFAAVGDTAGLCRLVSQSPLDEETALAAAGHPDAEVRAALSRNPEVEPVLVQKLVLNDSHVRDRVFADASLADKFRFVDVATSALSTLPADAQGREAATRLLGDLTGAAASLTVSEGELRTQVDPDVVVRLLGELNRLGVHREPVREMAGVLAPFAPRKVLEAVSGDLPAMVEVLYAHREDLRVCADDVPALLASMTELAASLPPSASPPEMRQVYLAAVVDAAARAFPGSWQLEAFAAAAAAPHPAVKVAVLVPLVASLLRTFSADSSQAAAHTDMPAAVLALLPLTAGTAPARADLLGFLDGCLQGHRQPTPPEHVWAALFALAPKATVDLAVFTGDLGVLFAQAAPLEAAGLLRYACSRVDSDRVAAARRLVDAASAGLYGSSLPPPGSPEWAAACAALVAAAGQDVVLSLPWPYLMRVPPSPELNVLASSCSRKVDGALRTRDELVTLVGLSTQWSGTFGALLDTARAAAGPV